MICGLENYILKNRYPDIHVKFANYAHSTRVSLSSREFLICRALVCRMAHLSGAFEFIGLDHNYDKDMKINPLEVAVFMGKLTRLLSGFIILKVSFVCLYFFSNQ